jgi:ESCRT-I complex subunit TSG101
VAAPPIPPNPEKDALLRQLAVTLASLRQRSRQQNDSSMAGLHAQRTALLSVVPTMQAEVAQLSQLSSFATSNTSILHEALHKADAVIEGSKSHPKPDIDELLVAPTLVSNQLYSLVAEERALGDAIFMLGRAVERGRITPTVFAKTTRSLAREWYLKKALVRKIGQGMGLAS